MSALLDALGWVGESLDKPGRAIRGMLGGQGLEAAKNLIPFSDTMGITDPSQNVTGRNLLERAGLLSQKGPDDGLDWGDAAGFGVEMLLDPTNYVGLGTLKRLRDARRLATMGDEAASLAGKGARAAEEAATAGRGAAAAEAAAPPFYPGVSLPYGRPLPSVRGAYLSEAERAASPALASVGDQSRQSLGLAIPREGGFLEALRDFVPASKDTGLAGGPFRELHQNLATFRDVRPLTDAQAGRLGAMLDAGRDLPAGYAMNLAPQGSSGPAGWLAKTIHSGGMHPDDALARFVGGIDNANIPHLGKGIQGLAMPPEEVAGVFAGASAPWKTRRHELVHGLIDQAQRTGRISDLPYIAQPAAFLNDVFQRAPADDALGRLAGGYGQVLDEVAAHALENRGLFGPNGQLAGLSRFLFKQPDEFLRRPWEAFDLEGTGRLGPSMRNSYYRIFKDFNPQSAEFYRRLGNLPWQAAAAGIGLGGGALLETLLKGNE